MDDDLTPEEERSMLRQESINSSLATIGKVLIREAQDEINAEKVQAIAKKVCPKCGASGGWTEYCTSCGTMKEATESS